MAARGRRAARGGRPRSSTRSSRFESLLVQYLQTITVYVDSKDRSLGGRELRQRLALPSSACSRLKRELDRRLSPRRRRSRGRAPGESRFGGARRLADLRRVRGSVPRLARPRSAAASKTTSRFSRPPPTSWTSAADAASCSGCLRERRRAARGVDANPAMVEACRARGLDVEQGDALAFLERQTDGSIGGLVGDSGGRAFRAGVSDAISRDGVPQDASGRAARARDHQSGLLDGVLRDLHSRPDPSAAASPRHAALPGRGERLRRRRRPVPAAGRARRSARAGAGSADVGGAPGRGWRRSPRR